MISHFQILQNPSDLVISVMTSELV
jgi:hypothetical protein